MGDIMELEQYAYLAEILGVIVVVATLIYLSVQVRQGASLMRSEARQAQVSADLEIIYKWMEYPDIQESVGNPEKLEPNKKVRLYYWLIAFSRIREHLWFQYRDGVLDEDAWTSYRTVIPFILSTERTRRYWAEFSPNFDPAYVKMVNDLIEGPSIWTEKYWADFAATD